MNEKNEKDVNAKIAVYIPLKVISLLQKTFNLKDSEIENFIVSLIERTAAEHSSKSSEAFTEEEAKEIEDNLKGLGYI